MKKSGNEHLFFPFLLGLAFTAFFFFGLYYLRQLDYLEKDNYVYLFFFRSWYVQAVTTWLYSAAMIFVFNRLYCLGDERKILAERISLERAPSISRKEAEAILEGIPSEYRTSMGFRRIDELLRAYLHGEEVIRLNQELSRRDVEQIETGHLVLNALRQLIPVLGFLGTVVGLSLGMVQFARTSGTTQTVDGLRSVLNEFAAKLSIAFDTTLLALIYMVVVVLVVSMLRHTEETFVAAVDHKARLLIMKMMPEEQSFHRRVGRNDEPLRGLGEEFKARVDHRLGQEFARWMGPWQTEMVGVVKGSLESLSTRNEQYIKQVADSLRQNGDAVIQKLEELKHVLGTPRNQEIIVQATGAKHNE